LEDARLGLANLSLQDSTSGEAAGTTGATIHLKTSLLVPGLHSENVALTPMPSPAWRHCCAKSAPAPSFNMFNAAWRADRLPRRSPQRHPPSPITLPGSAPRCKDGDRVLVRLVPIGGG
jgi:hypothetical protein